MKIAVLMGGPSAEHEVSLNSGREVITHIDHTKYTVRAVVVGKDKLLYFTDSTPDAIPSLAQLLNPSAASGFTGPLSAASAAAVWEGCSLAFLALHGSYGEDGVVQGYLESIRMPYTGSGVYASAVAMNKITAKSLYASNGLSVPPHSLYGKRFPENTPRALADSHGFPCFVKCPQSGSSRLMGRATSPEELAAMLEEFAPFAPELLIETMITGIEFTCGVLEDGKGVLSALPPVEIRPKKVFFDYTAKYTAGESEELVPAPQPPELLERIQQTAIAAHQILGCRGVSRTDMIFADNTLFVLETNTLPGLTANSLLPKSYRAIGGTFTELIDQLITCGLAFKEPGIA